MDQKKDEKDNGKKREVKKEKQERKTKARSKSNVRDAIIAYFNFAQEKGYLAQGIPHPETLVR